MANDNNFVTLSKVNVNGKTEKKGRFTYLSWAFAIDELMKADPMAEWEFHEPKFFGQSMMVSCTVIAFGKSMYMWLPVMDHNNKAISNPDAMAVNKAMMRCLVKAIAVHGLGLYIYAGEDLPSPDDSQNYSQPVQQMPQPQVLDNDRFSKALAALEAGKFDKALLLNPAKFALTPQQIEIVRAA